MHSWQRLSEVHSQCSMILGITSSPEALVMLVMWPDDTADALAYFEKYTDKHLRLDELYMSHGKLSNTFPSQIVNRLQGTVNCRTTRFRPRVAGVLRAVQEEILFRNDDPPFIVLTETKFSFRCIPVWDRYSPHLTRVEKKHM